MHNHPNRADIQLTRKLSDASGFLDLPILDHLIFVEQAYYSFADEGML